MAAQALSGIAKDLTKMSSKSAIKLVVPEDAQSTLFKWVAILTGSKNALKGVGFFLGGLLLRWWASVCALRPGVAASLTAAWSSLLSLMRGELGKANEGQVHAACSRRTAAVNVLSAARFFLFGARDVWFVVGVPVFLATRARLELLAGRQRSSRSG